MGWKSVVWTSCLLPVLAGCGAVHRIATDACLAHTQHGIKHNLRSDARVAWQTVRAQHPRKAFTEEFHDGFLDGYVDYLDRGGASQPPPVPPIKYVKDKKYFTPEGHCLLRDYYLGFKYGTDVAVASGRREFLTVPVLLPDAPASAVEIPTTPAPVGPMPQPNPLPPPRPVPDNKFGPPRKSDDPPLEIRPPISTPTVPSLPTGTDRPKLPKAELPVIPPYNPDLSGGKFPPLSTLNDPDLLPAPNPPLPNVPVTPIPVPTDEPAVTIPPVLGPLPGPIPIPVMKVPLPAPTGGIPPVPPGIPSLPANVPTPSILDDIPVIPFKLTIPAPIPVGNLTLGK